MLKDYPTAFPTHPDGQGHPSFTGMSLRDWFAGQALNNPTICTGMEPDWLLRKWFGEAATNITKQRVVARQALEYADAMLAEREKSHAL